MWIVYKLFNTIIKLPVILALSYIAEVIHKTCDCGVPFALLKEKVFIVCPIEKKKKPSLQWKAKR